MSQAPTTNRWTPVPDRGAHDLMQAGRYTALAVWLCMLRDATSRQSWETSRPVSALRAETGLSRQTVLNAQRYLAEHGYIRIISGGGATRRKITFGLRPVENFGGRPAAPPDPKDAKPVGKWSL